MKNWNELRKNKKQDSQKKLRRAQLKRELLDWLAIQPDRMVLQEDFVKKINDVGDTDSLLHRGDFIVFEMDGKIWVHSREDHSAEFQNSLNEYEQSKFEAGWKACAALCGDVIRPGATTANTSRLYVVARTYTQQATAKRLGLPISAIQAAIKAGAIPSFSDPEGTPRIPASWVESTFADEAAREKITGFIVVKVRHLSLVAELSYSAIRGRLIKAGISTTEPMWGQVRGQWGLPQKYSEYKAIADERFRIWVSAVQAEKDKARQAALETERQALRREREERELLRRQLFELFPSWDGHDRSAQHVTLHLGPTNSGKTFQSINRLVQAGSGWYLAPLRLLAHEIFDTLNKNGTRCNLLTGEQRIDVDGATITAATIEMFDPRRSGNCVVIDEAHMLSDSQRGWAWTRAIMEATAPEVHIIGAPIVEELIKKMTSEIGVEIEVENYVRLTPLDVADKPWTLANLPDKTILVAFSRKMVLGLKTELERNHRRSVSVVYGNLPPEVRLKQADRFARGETEICVATDAIGMGLNLPADNVCFFETQKFDGAEVRTLTVNEIRQIGGRAGRYGLSEQGMIGALSAPDLNVIRNAIYMPTADIEFAHVAPSPESIHLMPGELSEKLQKWVTMAGIPPRWKEILKPVDLASQIDLARLLSPNDVKILGEDVALLLINAPCYRDTQDYWQQCARAIIYQKEMPVLQNLKKEITSATDLENYEIAIRCADIYLWLSQRAPFARFGPEQERVRRNRLQWSIKMDLALQKQVDTTRRCSACGRKLENGHRFNICNKCYRERRFD
jgi:hypothetical protein